MATTCILIVTIHLFICKCMCSIMRFELFPSDEIFGNALVGRYVCLPGSGSCNKLICLVSQLQCYWTMHASK